MSQVVIDREKYNQAIELFKGFDSEEVLTFAFAAMAYLHTKKVATLSLNSRGLHGSFHPSEEFNSGEFFWPFIEDSEQILSDKIDMINGNSFALPTLPPLNLSASSSNFSGSQKASPTATVPGPKSALESCPPASEPTLVSSPPVGLNQDFPIRSPTPLINLNSSTPGPDAPSKPLLTYPHLMSPAVPSAVSPKTTVPEDNMDNDLGSEEDVPVKSEASPSAADSLENSINQSAKEKSQQVAEELKQRLLSPTTPTTSAILSQIFQNFKAGKSSKARKAQGYDSLASSIILVDRLSCHISLRFLSIFHFIK